MLTQCPKNTIQLYWIQVPPSYLNSFRNCTTLSKDRKTLSPWAYCQDLTDKAFSKKQIPVGHIHFTDWKKNISHQPWNYHEAEHRIKKKKKRPPLNKLVSWSKLFFCNTYLWQPTCLNLCLSAWVSTFGKLLSSWLFTILYGSVLFCICYLVFSVIWYQKNINFISYQQCLTYKCSYM